MTGPFRILSVLLAAMGYASASIAPSSRKQALMTPRRALNKQLAVRGGAGPLDPNLVTKVATSVLLAQGTVATLAPEPSIKSYGGEPTAKNVQLMRNMGVTILDVGVMTYGLVFKDWSVNTAVGVNSLIWVTLFTGMLLNDEATTVGYKNDNIVVWLVLNLALAYFTLTDAACSNTITKAMALFVGTTCAPLMLFPDLGFKSYGHDLAAVVESDRLCFKCLGGWLSALGILIGCIATGYTPQQALGYAFIPLILLGTIMLFVSNDHEKVGAPKGPAYFWLLFDIIAFATLAID